jgi:hypothetical protein
MEGCRWGEHSVFWVSFVSLGYLLRLEMLERDS